MRVYTCNIYDIYEVQMGGWIPYEMHEGFVYNVCAIGWRSELVSIGESVGEWVEVR